MSILQHYSFFVLSKSGTSKWNTTPTVHMLLYVFFCVIRQTDIQVTTWNQSIWKSWWGQKFHCFVYGSKAIKNHSAVGDLCLPFCKEDSFCMVSINLCFLQSSGKSSVLENLVGRDFLPRGTCNSNCFLIPVQFEVLLSLLIFFTLA